MRVRCEPTVDLDHSRGGGLSNEVSGGAEEGSPVLQSNVPYPQ